MAGYVMHLAIGKEYAKRKKIENVEEFLKGCIAPDLQDKKVSHYLGQNRKARLAKFFRK